MRWKDLDFKLKAELIKLGVLSGIRDINLIRLLYDEQLNTVSDVLYLNNKVNLEQLSTGIYDKVNNYETPLDSLNELDLIIEGIQLEIAIEQIKAEQPELFKRDRLGLRINERPVPAMMDSSRVREDLSQRYDDIRKRVLSYKKYRAYGGYTDDPPFLQRILNNDNRSVVDWKNGKQKATHKLSYAQTPEGYIVYPEVQEVNGELHDFTDPKYKHGKWDALDNAIRNNDTLLFSNEQDALKYTQEYKLKYPEYFKLFDKGGYLSNTSIGHKVKKYKDGGPLKKKKENSLEYRLALFNNVDPRESYPSLITAIEYYLNVVDKMKKGDTSKNWKTDGSIGDATAEAAWAKYLNLPYNTNLLPIWNGDTVRLTKELENQIPIDTNFIKQDIENIKMNRDYDRSMGIFDREDAYRMALNTRRLTLDNLRKTYKTGKWVQMNEFMFNDLDPFDYYDQGSDYKTPLNVLLNFGLRYDKNTNSIIYGDKYDLNKYDYFLPGNPFIIRGSIPLEQKYNGGYISNTKLFLHKFDGGGYDNYDEPSVTIGYPELYYMGLLPEVEIVANKDLNKKELYLADLEWRDYLTAHPIQIGSELYNRLPNKAKAQIHKNRVTDAINKAALPTAVAVIAPTALTAGAASLVGSEALTAAADAAGEVGTKIAGTNLGKAASAFINNPYVDVGLTALGAYTIPTLYNSGVLNIKQGNYGRALGDFASIGLEGLGILGTINNIKNIYGPVNKMMNNILPKGVYTESTIPKTTRAASSKIETTPKYVINDTPGYLLKILMRGNPLEKLLSKEGTISINSIKALAQKGNNVEQEIINKILNSEEFAGLKVVDYNKFRKAVQNELVVYDRVPHEEYKDYGINRLGFEPADPAGVSIAGYANITPETFVFESSRIPTGNADHYNNNTLGHSRTYTTTTEPDVLHVMESLSDWAQKTKDLSPKFSYKADLNGNTNISFDNNGKFYYVENGKGLPISEFWDKSKGESLFETANKQFIESYSIPQATHLHKNYLQRQLQENMKLAAERGQTKMRYPTSETAAKIEGYKKENKSQVLNLRRLIQRTQDDFENGIIEYQEYEKLIDDLNNQIRIALNSGEYSPEHQTILKKYSDFPKLFKKLYKNQEVRLVTDHQGNTWYEVDVPKDYLNQEWQYKYGGYIQNKNGNYILPTGLFLHKF